MVWRKGRSVPACILAGLALVGGHGCATTGREGAPAAIPRQSAANVDQAALVHLLSRTSFGATPQSLDEVRRVGVNAYLDRQLHPERIDDSALERRLAAFETLRLSSREIADNYYQPAIQLRKARQAVATAGQTGAGGQVGAVAAGPRSDEEKEAFRKERLVLSELAAQKLLRAVYSDRQLEEVLVDFWFNHFNVFSGKGADRGLLTAYERDVIRPHVFGSFRELLGATAQSPAMLFYLDNWMSVDPTGPHAEPRPLPLRAARGMRAINPVRGRDLRPVPAKRAARGLNENYARELMELHTLGVDGGYKQFDVIEVARCFTGWTISQPREGGGFRFDPRQHDPGEKTVLGHRIKAGGGKSDGDAVLDLLARHPATARFIATKLVRRFVSDTPPADLVDAVAERFLQTKGDLREVYKAIFFSKAFWAPDARATKVKTPFEFVASALRVTGADVTQADSSVQAVRTLGMPLYGCLTPNGYGDTADTWLNAGTLLNRMNFALSLVDNRLLGVRIDLASLGGSPDLATARPVLLRSILEASPTPSTLATLDKAKSVPQLAALALAAPEFQKR